MRTSIKFFLAIFIMTMISCEQESITESGLDDLNVQEVNLKGTSAVAKTTTEVINPILGEVTGTSTLHRTKKGITATYKTTGLTPGYTYTLWWVVWNNPQDCGIPFECNDADFSNAANVQVEVMYAAGHVVGSNGKGNFGGHLNVKDYSTSINELFGLPSAGGLQKGKTFSSEIHLVLRSHGPAVPGNINEQINSYVGGCDDPLAIPPFTEIPDEVGECGDIEFAIHAPTSS